MAVSNAYAAFGTILAIGDGAGTESFTSITEVHDINGPGLSLETIESTHQLSPDATKEYVASLKDLQDVTFEIAWVPSDPTHDLSTGLMADWKNRTKRNFRITFPTDPAVTWQISGYVTAFKMKAPLKGLLAADVTLKLTGEITVV